MTREVVQAAFLALAAPETPPPAETTEDVVRVLSTGAATVLSPAGARAEKAPVTVSVRVRPAD